jgi:hypothetical protein
MAWKYRGWRHEIVAIGASFDTKLPTVETACERQYVDGAGRLHAGERSNAAERFAEEFIQGRPRRGTIRARFQAYSERMRRLEAGIHFHYPEKTLDQEPCANSEHERKCDLGCYQHVPHGPLRAPVGVPRGILEGRLQIGARGVKRGRQAGQDARCDAYQAGEHKHRHADGCIAQMRKIPRCEFHDQRNCPTGEQHSRETAQHRNRHAFGKQVAKDVESRRA